MHRWFVQYNPLYFASALLVLSGVVLMTRDPLDWVHGQLVLAGLIQLYELALIGGAALLFHRPGQRRPAVILGIVALAFTFDLAFRTEGLASTGVLPASLLWAALFATKLALLVRALRVRLPRLHAMAWTAGGLMLAVGPHFMTQAVLVAASWLGIALVGLVFCIPPRLTPRAVLDDWGRIVAARIGGFIPLFWALLYWLHIAAWCGIYEVRLTALCFLPAIAYAPFLVRGEGMTWLAGAVVLLAASLSPAHFTGIAIFLAVGLVAKALACGWPRLFIAAAAALAVPLLLPWLPARAGQWGAILLAGGFAALGAGVALNWWSGRIARDADLRIRLPLVRP
jgi:hypothetical protein